MIHSNKRAKRALVAMTGSASERVKSSSSAQIGARPDLLPPRFQVLVTCRDEDDQRLVYLAMREQGRTCRVMTM